MDIKKQTYRVEGMTCSGCERTVSRIVENIEGVKTAKADLNSATVTVEYNSTVSTEKLKIAINSAGYKFAGEYPGT